MTGVERVFNVLVYFDDEPAREYGVRHHRWSGDGAAKRTLLAAAVAADHPVAKRFRLGLTFTHAEWLALHRLGMETDLFEEGFAYHRAGPAPLYHA
jgi:hypothetical protein